MLNNVMIGRYYPINSKVHKMNPIAKIICVLLFIILSFLTIDIRFNLLLIVLLTLMILNTNVPLKIYLNTILSIKWIILVIFILSLFFGLNIAFISILRVIFIVLYTSILTLTTPPNEITYGLEKILFIFKLIGINTKKLALNISLILRLIPTIIDEKNKIMKSQASRGIDYYNIDLKGKILAYKSLLKPIFTLSMRKSYELSDSMDIRLYNASKKRINFRQNRWGIYDTFMVLLHLSLLALFIKEVVL